MLHDEPSKANDEKDEVYRHQSIGSGKVGDMKENTATLRTQRPFS